MKESCNFELARLKKKKKKKERKTFGRLAILWFGTFAMLFHATKHVVGHEALKNEWCIVIKAYRFSVFEILRDFVLSYIVCPRYPVYQLYNDNTK